MIEHIAADPDGGYSPAVQAGDWLFVSGQASTDPETGAFIPGTFDEEFARSVENLRRVLELAGAREEQIVRIGAFVRDEASLPRYNELYRETFKYPRPARTTSSMGFDFLQIELECVAYLGNGSSS